MESRLRAAPPPLGCTNQQCNNRLLIALTFSLLCTTQAIHRLGLSESLELLSGSTSLSVGKTGLQPLTLSRARSAESALCDVRLVPTRCDYTDRRSLCSLSVATVGSSLTALNCMFWFCTLVDRPASALCARIVSLLLHRTTHRWRTRSRVVSTC